MSISSVGGLSVLLIIQEAQVRSLYQLDTDRRSMSHTSQSTLLFISTIQVLKHNMLISLVGLSILLIMQETQVRSLLVPLIIN